MSTTRPYTAAVLTQGCKVNQYESEALSEALAADGWELHPSHDVCDLYVVNTCTVTAESDRKARQVIRHLLSANPEAYMIVTGCSAQSHADAIAAIPGVDCVVGNRNKMEVVKAAAALRAGGVKPDQPAVLVSDLTGSAFEPMSITRFARTRAYVKIEDGCESRCTYCAIPDARGPVRSKPLADVLREVETLTRGGCREIVLTGIETGSWGRDLPPASDDPASVPTHQRLCDLLQAVDSIPGIGRIRLGSLDPSVITPTFADSLAGLSCLAPHFHLSVQSGCSATLARMKRKYNARQAQSAMERLRAAIPGVKFTADMIVGFPGETEEEFAESLDFARRAGFLHIHVFPYSRRENTPAAVMPDQVPEACKHERVAALSRVSTESCVRLLDGAVDAGTPVRVLFESREDGYVFGHTPDFMEVKVRCDRDLRGIEQTVLPIGRDGEVLTATLL